MSFLWNRELKTETRDICFIQDIPNAHSHSPLSKLKNILCTIEGCFNDEMESPSVVNLIWKRKQKQKRKAEEEPKLSPSAKSKPNSNAFLTVKHSMMANSYLEAKKFMTQVVVIRILVETLSQARAITRRDVYYRDVRLFSRQTAVDGVIDDLSYSLGLPCYELGVIASQKGLIFGDLRMEFANPGSKRIHHVTFSKSSGSGLIPVIPEKAKIFLDDDINAPHRLEYILVVEKEAVFKTLVDLETGRDGEGVSHNRIIVTGKGFPDQLTKRCIRNLATSFPQVPIFAFVDSDVYGLMILRQYTSLNIAPSDLLDGDLNFSYSNQNEQNSHIPLIRYMGVELFDYSSGWLEITMRDFRVMKNFLVSLSHFSYANRRAATEHCRWSREIQRGMFCFKKSEMNVVSNKSVQDIDEYVNEKVKRYFQN